MTPTPSKNESSLREAPAAQRCSGYCQRLADGRYEYGRIECNERDRRRDRQVPEGIADTHEQAMDIILARCPVGA